MKPAAIANMLDDIDVFYDQKVKTATLYEKGKISLVQFKQDDRALDDELHNKLKEYNEQEEHSLYKLNLFARRQ